MPNLEIENIPDDLYQQLVERARVARKIGRRAGRGIPRQRVGTMTTRLRNATD